MSDRKCPACGSSDVSDFEDNLVYSAPYDDEITYSVTIQRCQTCCEEGDFYDTTSELIKAVIDTANSKSVGTIIETLAEIGVTMAYIERALGLAARTLFRWKKKNEVSAAGITLMRIIRTYPWILEVAASQFDASVAKEALEAAARSYQDSCVESKSHQERAANDSAVDPNRRTTKRQS